MLNTRCRVGVWIAFTTSLIACANPLVAAFTTTGTYDAATNGNVVDVSATSDSGVEISLSSFTTLVDLAYQADAGGVIDFDSGSLTGTDTIDATVGVSATKSITITDATVGTLQVVSPSPSTISGNASLRKTLSTFVLDRNDFKFDFDPGDGVKAVGATITSQFTLGQPIGDVWAIVRYDDNTSSPSVTDFIENSTSGDDTFWGFQAPEGKSITRFELIISNDKWAFLDDLAFVLDFTPPPVTGDLDGDGFVGIGDLNLVLALWNEQVGNDIDSRADPSGDGFVGIQDLNIVLGNWNAGIPPTEAAAAPEPGTLVLLGLLGSSLITRRVL
ncbi:MAG: PEP-CTERM sorting domain-containing protein [Planctomycetota bacterium]|jgi:hypothetical protein